MRQRLIVLIGGVLLVFSFQNCQKSNLNLESSPAVQNSKNVEYNKSSAADYSVLQLWDYENGKTFDLDLASGRVAAYADFGSNREQDLCFTPELRDELAQIMKDSEVCQPVFAEDYFKDRICTQNYRYPYAVLVHGGDQVKLGEETSGCDIATDLCADKAEQLQQFVKKVLPQMQSLTCN